MIVKKLNICQKVSIAVLLATVVFVIDNIGIWYHKDYAREHLFTSEVCVGANILGLPANVFIEKFRSERLNWLKNNPELAKSIKVRTVVYWRLKATEELIYDCLGK